MYILIFLQVVFWGYWLLCGMFALLNKRTYTKPLSKTYKARTEEIKNPALISGAKYYSVKWDLKTGEVVEEVSD